MKTRIAGGWTLLKLRWFLCRYRQPLRNKLSAEGSFESLSMADIVKHAVDPYAGVVKLDQRRVDKFISQFPLIFVTHGVFEWRGHSCYCNNGTPGIYIRDVFHALPKGVYRGYEDFLHGQLLFIPMYTKTETLYTDQCVEEQD